MPRIVVLSIALIATAPPARAETPVAAGPEFQVNTYTTRGSNDGDTSLKSIQSQRPGRRRCRRS